MILCFVLFLSAVVACLAAGQNLIWALLVGLGLFFGLGLRRGYSARTLWAMAWKKGRDALIVVPVFLIIGAVTALWRSGGTIAFFLYYGLRGIPPELFVLVAFLLSAGLSFALGTSYGVCGTAGVVLMTLARSGGVDPAVAAGAVVSGAYFGDRCSPMSSCANLVAGCTGTKLYRNVREMLRTALLPTLLSVLIYWLLSLRHPVTAVDESVLLALRDGFSLAWPVLVPAAVMLVLPLLRMPVKWAMAISAAAALTVTVTLQDLPLGEALRAALLGYVPREAELAGILSGGGVISMATASGIVFITSLYAGILEGIDALAPVRARVEQLAERLGLFSATALVSLLIVAVFCNQSVAIIMGEQLMGESYRRRDASRQTLAIDMANSTVVLAAWIPWSIAISVPLSMLGADMRAMPYAVLVFLIPLCYLFTRRWFLAGQRD